MAENEKRSPKKLGQSTSVKIGGKQYTSNDMQSLKQQTKEVHTATDMVNAPRDINKEVVNLTNTVKTENIKNLTDSCGSKTTATINSVNAKPIVRTENINRAGINNDTVTINVSEKQLEVIKDIIITQKITNAKYGKNNDSIHTISVSEDDYKKINNELTKRKVAEMQIETKIATDTIISDATARQQERENYTYQQKEMFDIVNKANKDSALNSAKTTDIQKIKETSEIAQQAKKSVQRQSAIVVTSQTVISKSKVQSDDDTPKTNITLKHLDNTKKSNTQNNTKTKNATPQNNKKTNTSQTDKSKSQNKHHKNGTINDVLKRATRKTKNALDEQNDSGSSTLSTALTAGEVSTRVFKTAQDVSPHVVKGAVGVYHVGEKTVKVVKGIDTTVGMVKTGAIKLDKDTAMRVKNMAVNKLKNTKPAQKLLHAITGIQTAVNTAKCYSIKIGYDVKRTVVLVQGMALGTVKVKITKDTLNAIKNTAIKGAIKGAKVGVNVAGYTIKTGVKTGIKIGKGINRGLLSTGDMLTNTDDMGAQALGYGLKTTHYVVKGIATTPKLAKASYKGIKTGVNTMVKTGKFTVRTYQGARNAVFLAKKAGKKVAFKYYANSLRGKAVKAIQKAGNSIVTAVIEGAKKLGMKIVLPLLLILLVVACGSNVISSFGTAVASILSPFFSDDSGNEVDESAWLTSHITAKRNQLIQDIKDTYNDNLVANGGQYHYVRFFNDFSDTEIELTDTNINTSIYTVSEYQEYIQPIFHTLILSEYEMEASESEMQSLLDELWDKMSIIKTEELPMEYCQMTKTDNADGTYTVTPVKENDGNVHADISTCPNYSAIQYHADDVGTPLCSCDHWYWICNGHKGSCTHSCNNDCAGGCHHTCGLLCHMFGCDHTCGDSCKKYCGHTHSEWHSASNSGCYTTNYHSGQLTSNCGNATQHKGCNGYYICQGHKVLALSFVLGNFGDLLNDYYLTEIHDLESRASLTTDEQKQLQELKDYYEICINYITVLEDELGVGGGTVVDLDGVTLTNVTDFACSFIGNPYVWGGTDPNTGADCSGFVQYVYAHFGVSLPRTSREQVTCGVTVPSISEAQAGDLIFYSEDGTDSGVYHVTMYLGNGKLVHASNSKPYPRGGIKVSNVYGTIYKIKRIAH